MILIEHNQRPDDADCEEVERILELYAKENENIYIVYIRSLWLTKDFKNIRVVKSDLSYCSAFYFYYREIPWLIISET